MGSNPLLDKWRAGETTLGAMCRVPGGVGVELVARQGFDYIAIDGQHGMIDFGDAVTMMQAVTGTGAVPTVRVPALDAAIIGQYLDGGAFGVTVPMVNSAEEAEQVVAACRYPTRGTRSYGPLRASLGLGAGALEDVAVIVMVETAVGLENVDEIAAVPGVDSIYVGPSDLAWAFGLTPDGGPHKEVEAAVEQIVESCERHGIVAGIQCTTGELGRERIDQGFRMVTVAQDVRLLSHGAKEQLRAARGGE